MALLLRDSQGKNPGHTAIYDVNTFANYDAAVSTFQFLLFGLCPLFAHIPDDNIRLLGRFHTWHSPCLGSENHTRAKNMPAPVQQYPWRSADQLQQLTN